MFLEHFSADVEQANEMMSRASNKALWAMTEKLRMIDLWLVI